MRWIGVMVVMVAVTSCGMPMTGTSRGSLAGMQPHVLEMLPEDGASLDATSSVTLKFSHPIDADSVLPQSILMLSQWQGGVSSTQLLKDISSGAVKSIPVRWELSQDATELQVFPQVNSTQRYSGCCCNACTIIAGPYAIQSNTGYE